MKWIGITGNLGSGKSTVAALIREMGHPVVDADILAREALGPSSPLLGEIRRKFGEKVFNERGELDRRALGRLVFDSKQDLLWLESHVHPLVQKQVKSLRAEFEKKRLILGFYDVPLLYEKKLEASFDAVVVVSSPIDFLKARVAQRDGLSEKDILSRLENQIPLHEKEALADFVIVNDGDLEHLRREVKKVLKELETLG